MTFLERYNKSETWQERAIVMELFHLAMLHKDKGWTLSKTAFSFEVSIGLVSENLRLAHAIHLNDKILKCESRQDALKKLANAR